MQEEKKWFQSRTILAAMVLLIATVVGFFGFEVDTTAQGEIVNGIEAIITAVGALVIIWGRVRADKKVTK